LTESEGQASGVAQKVGESFRSEPESRDKLHEWTGKWERL